VVVDAAVKQRTRKTTLRSERGRVLEKGKIDKKLEERTKKDLTGPTLLEITG
jgi:hypothetical protein